MGDYKRSATWTERFFLHFPVLYDMIIMREACRMQKNKIVRREYHGITKMCLY